MKRIFTITESEREAILSKHQAYKKSLLKEEGEAQPRYKIATCATDGKGPKCVDQVLRLQMLMNDKCPSNVLTVKLVEDGLIGGANSKTNLALKVCDSYIRVQQGPGVPAGAQNTVGNQGTNTSTQGNTTGAPSGSNQGSSSTEQFDSLTV